MLIPSCDMACYREIIKQQSKLVQHHQPVRVVNEPSSSSLFSLTHNHIDFVCIYIPRCGATIIENTNDNISDIMYQRYAACLAATEDLRRKRDAAIQESSAAAAAGNRNKNNHRAMKEYITHASKIIEDMGLSISEFNTIGRQVCNDPTLKQKVIEQAYLYRMKSTIQMDTNPEIVCSNEQPSSKYISKTKFHNFCHSLYDMEQYRIQHVNEIQQLIQVPKSKFLFPSMISKKQYSILQPYLSTTVRHAIETFPHIVNQKIVHQKYGFTTSEYNQLLSKLHHNIFFRWKVLYHLHTNYPTST